MQVDFLIIGQGLAGSLLARALKHRGQKVMVVDDGWKSSSSQVAAGLMTPLTGRRFTLTPEYPELFQRAQKILSSLNVFRSIEVYRIFVDAQQREQGLKRSQSDTCRPFIKKISDQAGELDSRLTDEWGGALMSGAWVDLPKLLHDSRIELQAENAWRQATFDPGDVQITSDFIQWRDVTARGLIYCDGYKSSQRGPFTYLPWKPAKGEAITFQSPVLQTSFVLNREGWALPIGKGRWRAGTNWEWTQLDENPSSMQKEKLIRRFIGYFREPIMLEVTEHVAGVRPCTSDSYPMIGTHPSLPRVHLFNGMGPRGTVWAPTLAEEMADYLVKQSPLRAQCDLRRFPISTK